jgi:hypothetical protein
MASFTKLSRLILPAALAVQVAGCANSELSRTFGLVRDTPDEFTVVTRAPLSMPPDFTLRPPMPGMPRPQERSAQSQAEAALVPDSALGLGGRGGMSTGQAALVRDAGGQAPPDIRQRIDQEARVGSNDDRFIDKLLFWQPGKSNNAVIDPAAEAERLRRDAALGAPPVAGDTPIIREEKKSWFSRLFSGG